MSVSFLITKNDSTFSALFPNVQNKIGDIDFGLSGDGELVRLFNESDEIIDQLTYNDKAPWPLEADGLGATLSLTNPGFDNSKGENWAASIEHGTPGIANNDVIVSNEEEQISTLPNSISMNQNYPNPFNPSTTISYAINKSGQVTLKVYDITGRVVSVLVNENKSQGRYNIIWNATALSSGIYFYRLEAFGESITKRLSLIK